jgi:hypothetical protein
MVNFTKNTSINVQQIVIIKITAAVELPAIWLASTPNIAVWAVKIGASTVTVISRLGQLLFAMASAVRPIAANVMIVTSTPTNVIAVVAIITPDTAITMAQKILGRVPITADTTTMPTVSMADVPDAPMVSANASAMIHSYAKAANGCLIPIVSMVAQMAIATNVRLMPIVVAME